MILRFLDFKKVLSRFQERINRYAKEELKKGALAAESFHTNTKKTKTLRIWK